MTFSDRTTRKPWLFGGEFSVTSSTALRPFALARSRQTNPIFKRHPPSKCAQDALEDMCSWLNDDCGEVAVYDATNSTFERRQLIHETVVEKYGYKLFFVESICNAPDIIEANIREVKVS